MTGKGTKIDPYIVHSTRGFLYLTNRDVCGIGLGGKYIALGCDIELNDETFDENGNPTGGDGVVYSWIIISGFSYNSMSLNGNFYTIKGAYINDDTKDYMSLFGRGTLQKVENIKIDNFFIYGKTFVSCFGAAIREAKNISVLGGCFIANGIYASSISTTIISAENCVSYADVKSQTSSACGLFNLTSSASNTTITKCKNYGGVSSYGWVSSGIIGDIQVNTIIYDCVNYGHISSHSGHLSGIAGIFYQRNATLFIRDCANYGVIETETTDYAPSGIMSIAEKYIHIYNCVNYGILNSPGNTAEILGVAYHTYQAFKNTEIYIEKCYAKSDNSNSYIIGGLNAPLSILLEINDCKFDFSNGKDIRKRGLLIPSVPQAAKICVKNLHIILQENLEVVSIIDTAKHNSGKVYVDNMLITTKSIEAGINSAIFTQAAQTNKFMVDGCVVCFSDKYFYYGSDFSGFYVDYKTGRLGLKALSGKGFYQGKVTEEYLISKGYRKKAI